MCTCTINIKMQIELIDRVYFLWWKKKEKEKKTMINLDIQIFGLQSVIEH